MKRCGSLCWTAQEEKCACICAGAMHGRGSQARRDFVQKALGRIPRTLAEWDLAAPKLSRTQIRQIAEVEIRRLGA